MQYRIVNETKHRIRIRMMIPPMNEEQEDVVRFAFSAIEGVETVTVFRATSGCALVYHCDRALLLEKLSSFRYENVQMLSKTMPSHIQMEEMRLRKLDPQLKRKLRARILVETAADLIMPAPVQIGYHIYQMITLRDI